MNQRNVHHTIGKETFMSHKLSRITVLASLAVFMASFAHAEGDGWIVDFEKAKETAAKEKKDILMDFTGSDWCGYCIKLHDEVFTKDEFAKEAPKSFVLLKLDFPKDTSKQTKAEIDQNSKLNEQYKVSGYPTIFLADTKGRPYGKLVGYDGTPAGDYMKKLLEMQKVRVQRDDLFGKAEQAKELEKAKLLDQALSLLDAELVLAMYRDEMEQIVALDKDNTATLKGKYENILLLEKVQKQINEIVQKNQEKPKECMAALDALFNEIKPTGVVAQEILYARAFMKYQSKDMVGARADLDTALKAEPNSPKAEEIRQVIEQVFNKKEEDKEANKEEKQEQK